jgi:hypothetical protein
VTDGGKTHGETTFEVATRDLGMMTIAGGTGMIEHEDPCGSTTVTRAHHTAVRRRTRRGLRGVHR